MSTIRPKPRTLWIWLSLCAAILALVCVAAALRPSSGPKTPQEAAERLKAEGLYVYAVRLDGDLSAGFYLSDHESPLDGLHDDTPAYAIRSLPRRADRIGEWKGVVLIAPFHEGDDPLGQWGDCAVRIGPLLLFGDPIFMARLADKLKS